MKKLLSTILLIELTMLILSCEKPQLSVGEYTPSLVVISNFTTHDGIKIQVSRSRSPLDNGPTEYIANAQVEILNSEQVLEQLDFIETRNAEAPYYTTQDIKPRVGVDYTVRVSARGFKTVTATSRIPELVHLDSVNITDLITEPDDPGYKFCKFNLIIYFTDPRLERNFYHVNVFQKSVVTLKDGMDKIENISKLTFGSEINNNYLVANYDGGFLIEDKLLDGRSLRIPIPISIRMPLQDQQMDEMIVELRSVSEEYYLFHASVSRQQDYNKLPLADPIVLFNNIRNGRGVFAGYSQAQQAVSLKTH